MSIKRYKIKGRDIPVIAIEFLPDVVVCANDHDAAMAAKEARIADLEQAIYDLRYAHRYAPPCQAGGVAKCQCWNCVVDRAVFPAAQQQAEPATHSEDGREELTSAKAFEAAMPGYKAMVGDAKASRIEGRRIEQPSNMFKSWLECCAQHERIVAEKDVEIARLNELVEHRDYLARIDHIRAELRAERQQAKDSEVTILPDGSAYALASYPLSRDHWLYAEREYDDDADEPKELPAPILNHADHRETVIAAIRYAVRGATNCGKEKDFDPDALVQNAVYALCGPYGRAQPVRQAGGDDAECLDCGGSGEQFGSFACAECNGTGQARAALAPAAVAVVLPAKAVIPDQMTFPGGAAYYAKEFDKAVSRNATLDEVARLNRRAIPAGLLEKAADLLKSYQQVIDGCHSSEIERFDYQPEVQGTADELRALLGKEGE